MSRDKNLLRDRHDAEPNDSREGLGLRVDDKPELIAAHDEQDSREKAAPESTQRSDEPFKDPRAPQEPVKDPGLVAEYKSGTRPLDNRVEPVWNQLRNDGGKWSVVEGLFNGQADLKNDFESEAAARLHFEGVRPRW
jgi:hypothetical protein